MQETIGLYLHIPFCVRKCSYCDFLSFSAPEDVKQLYAAALIREIRAYAGTLRDAEISSIFIGGGTPSILPARKLREIFGALRDNYRIAPDAEITMEMNPGTVNASNLSVLAGFVNRVSLGVQSSKEEELKSLGRIHLFREAARSVELLRKSGIRNLNLDLMSGIPGQTVASWRESLEAALSLRPEHLSAYSLIVEEGTAFAELQSRGQLPLPDEDTEREMYALTGEILEAAGYRQYEFSNYAREGYACRHNIRYWKRGDYVGFGLGAASLYQRRRWRNTRSFETYLKESADPGCIIRDAWQLTRREEIEEFLFLGLRMTEGISGEEFRRTFGMPVTELYGDVLRKHVAEGLLQVREDGEGERYALTRRGIEISNTVLADYLLD